MVARSYTTHHSCQAPLVPHRHAGGYLALVESGEYLESSVDGVYRCRPGMVVMHPPWHLHCNTFDGPTVRVNNMAAQSSLPYGVHRLRERHWRQALVTDEAELLTDMVLNDGRPVPALELPVVVSSMMHALLENPGWRIDALAEAHRISPEHAAREFRRHTGFSPGQFAREERLRRAMRDLAAGQCATDVACEHGFADQPHLCRSIKKATTLTVGQFVQGTSSTFKTES